MLFSVEQAFVKRDEIQAPLKTHAWESTFKLNNFKTLFPVVSSMYNFQNLKKLEKK